MKKTILSLNCGSSSLKYNVFRINDDLTVTPVLNGNAEEIGNPQRSTMTFKINGEKNKYPVPLETHEDAINEMISVFRKNGITKESICAVGHRIVHGGPVYTKSTLITDDVKKQIRELFSVAPLHNPQNYIGVEEIEKRLPGVPNVAVFDTAFHGTMGEEAFRYAIPEKWYRNFLIRRYGFHGTSHLYVSKRAAVLLKTPYNKFTCITAHLGNGSRITKVETGT
ncbi:MAG TPA: acetate kinase, partial [Clostridia bacterium]|nr:acetate kinase [Clostridia bacterium]